HNVMTRYAGNEDATRRAFHDGWFHSQDIGFAVPDGDTGRTFYVTTGRIKNIAKVRGESVSLEEMERVLRAHPAVHDAACTTRPDRPPAPRAGLEQRLAATVTGAVTCSGGFSPGVAARLQLTDGRQVFVKAVGSEPNAHAPELHRREARVAAVLPSRIPSPRL